MINDAQMVLMFVMGFFLIALGAKQIGEALQRYRFPLISGFLLTGIIAGPHVLNLVSLEAIQSLGFVNEISLAFIAFAAGNELVVRQLKGRFKNIRYITLGLVVSTFTLGSAAFFLLSRFIPFTQSMPPLHRIAVSILAGAILVARSPSSAIAVVNELRARGPFTRTVLGVTVIMDVVVISFFSINTSVAATLFEGREFRFRFLAALFAELGLSVLLGYGMGKVMQGVLAGRFHRNLKTALILASGYVVFLVSGEIRHLTHTYLTFEILLEPMLVCMVASFWLTNHTHFRTDLMKVLHDIGPVVYIAFFTLTGASLALDVLAQTWMISLALFAVRLLGIFVGSFGGGLLAGEERDFSKISWMCYITQAGVGLGLAKQVAVEFPDWGTGFATIVIAVIVLNQLLGPPLFKAALFLSGEVPTRTGGEARDNVRDALIFGLEGDSLALARLLQSNRWETKIITTQAPYVKQMAGAAEVEIHSVSHFSPETLKKLGAGRADAVVAMMSDEDNYRICQLVCDHFGTRNMIVRLNNHRHYKRFRDLGAMVVDPSTAIVSLMDQFVRSPSTATLLLGMEQGREIIEFELRNPDLQGLAIRDLHLPLDTHILSVRRQGQMMVTGGFTQLQTGDWLTVFGSKASLEQMMLNFGENREHAIVNMVRMAVAKEIAAQGVKEEVKAAIHETDGLHEKSFETLIQQSVVLDLDGTRHYDHFFRQAAESLSAFSGLSAKKLFELLMDREAESSTVLRPDLAVPHIIIEGENAFHVVMARCKEGIHFSTLAPKVRAVFVLAGTRDCRGHHLHALSSIAEVVQQPHFQERWLKAGNETTLKHIVLSRKKT